MVASGGRRGALITLDGIGVLRVACTRHPRAVFVLTRFAAGEAFQFVASISDLLAPSARRCDLLAQATVVTHGQFYRYAHGA